MNFIKYFIVSIIISFSMLAIFFYNPNALDQIDGKFKDYIMKIDSKNPKFEDNIIIVNVDDASIEAIGQWPWSRNVLAKIVENISEAKASLLAVNIIFSEPDRSSPINLFDKLDMTNINGDYDYDKVLATAIENVTMPVVLGYNFLVKDNNKIDLEVPYIPAIYVQKNPSMYQDYYLNANSINLNIPIIQDSATSSGYLNFTPDESGYLRSMPLVIKFDGAIYPSLSLEVIRVVYGSKKVVIANEPDGIESIKIDDLVIPTNISSELSIKFKNSKKYFKHISAIDVLSNNFDSNFFENKVVLFGSDAGGITTYNNTPIEELMSGVEIQANIISNILNREFIYVPKWHENFEIIFILAFIFVLSTLLFNSFVTLYFFLFLTINILFVWWVYYSYAEYGFIQSIIYIPITSFLTYLIIFLFKHIEEIKKSEYVKNQFASKVSKDVMNDILRNNGSEKLRAQQKDITVFFSDIAKFTQISEQFNDPQKLSDYLNKYMNPMTEIIMRNSGTVDKFIGDAIMAYWNAPNDVENHRDLALTTALEQNLALEDINKEFEKNGLPFIGIRVGLSSGTCFIGEMGSSHRSDYTALGKVVNYGSVLEQLCKYYNTKIIISENVKRGLKGQYTLRLLDLIQIEKSNEAFNIYEVFKLGLPTKEEANEIELFEKAIDDYRKANFEESLLIFRTLFEDERYTMNKEVYRIYLQRTTYEYHNKFEKFVPIQQISKGFFVMDNKFYN